MKISVANSLWIRYIILKKSFAFHEAFPLLPLRMCSHFDGPLCVPLRGNTVFKLFMSSKRLGTF